MPSHRPDVDNRRPGRPINLTPDILLNTSKNNSLIISWTTACPKLLEIDGGVSFLFINFKLKIYKLSLSSQFINFNLVYINKLREINISLLGTLLCMIFYTNDVFLMYSHSNLHLSKN